MKICICIEANVNNNVFEELRELHKVSWTTSTKRHWYRRTVHTSYWNSRIYANPNAIKGKPCISSVSEFYDDTIILE